MLSFASIKELIVENDKKIEVLRDILRELEKNLSAIDSISNQLPDDLSTQIKVAGANLNQSISIISTAIHTTESYLSKKSNCTDDDI